MISVIMPTYNRAWLIEASINSILNQTYRDLELIIIDDGSTDDTAIRVGQIKDERVKYISYKYNKGQSHARNVGIKNSNGEYLAFLDSDNIWTANYLENRMKIIKHRKNEVIVFGNMYTDIEKKGMFPGIDAEILNDRKKLIRLMLLSNRIDTNTVMISRGCVDKIGYFDESMRALEDWDYFLRVIQCEDIDVVFDETAMVFHTVSKDSLSLKSELFLSNRLEIFKKNFDLIKTCDANGNLDPDMDFVVNTPYVRWEEYLKSICGDKTDLCWFFIWTIKKQNVAWKNVFADWITACNNLKMWDNINSADKILHGMKLDSIAIYGYGKYGRALTEKLKESRISVKYIVDRNVQNDLPRNTIYVSSVSDINDVDAIIVSIVIDGDKIKDNISEETELPVYWLKELGEN